MAPLLDVQHVDVSYNGRAVVHDVSFQLEAGGSNRGRAMQSWESPEAARAR